MSKSNCKSNMDLRASYITKHKCQNYCYNVTTFFSKHEKCEKYYYLNQQKISLFDKYKLDK